MNLKFCAAIRTVACALALALVSTMAPAEQLNLKQIAGIDASVVTALNNATNAASGLVALDSSGNLGLGITAATHIHSYLSSGTNTLRVQSGANGIIDMASDGTNGFLTAYVNGSLNLSASGSGALNFYTNGALRLGISSSGAVTIGGSLTASTFSGSGSALTALSAANMAVAQPDANATSRTALSKHVDIISVLDFLPVGQPDGTTDNSTGFQYAASAGCARASDGAQIFVPAPPSAHNYVAHDVLNVCPNVWAGGGRGGRGGTQSSRGAEYNAANSSSNPITSFSGSASPYTIGFAANLNLKVGTTVTVAGATPSTLNGVYTITASSAGSVTATTPQTGTWSSGGTVTGQTAYKGGPTIDYSSGTAFFMRWAPNANGTLGSTWYTSTTPQQLMLGGGIRDMNLWAGTNDTNKFALQVYGTYDFAMDHLTIIAPYNAVEIYGDEMPSADNVQIMHAANWNYWLHGDLKGLNSYGATPAAGSSDTSTRVDAFKGTNLQNIDNGGTNSTFFITDMVDDTMLDHTSAEGPAYALNIGCSFYTSVTPNYDPNGGNCPHFIITYDFESEFCAISCVHATDFIGLRIHNGYFYNQNVSAAVDTLYISSANYSSSSVPVGRVTIDGGTQVFVAQQDGIVLNGTMYDVDINHTEINGVNAANGGGYGINAHGTITHLKINNDTIGNVDGYVGAAPPTAAVNLSSAVKFAEVGDNIFDGVGTTYAPVLSAVSGANAATIHVHDNVGPGGSPTPSSCGTGPSIAAGSMDNNFLLTVGSGAPTSCTVTFGTPKTTTPQCSWSPIAGSSATMASYTGSNFSITLYGSSGMTGSWTIMCKDT
jgi:hypothetical protein